MTASAEYVTKTTREPEQVAAEAAGLAWLAEAAPQSVAKVISAQGTTLVTERVAQVPPSAQAAEEFGRTLAQVHRAGAAAFGAPPAHWDGPNYIGRITQPCEPTAHWGQFYVQQRVLPFVQATEFAHGEEQLVYRACELIADTEFDYEPARIHGDLWAGNILFSAEGVVMIDPAAHGGAGLSDLAMLELFGAPHLPEIFRGYGVSAGPWLALHQLHPLAVHSLTHGRSYHRELAQAAQRTIDFLG